MFGATSNTKKDGWIKIQAIYFSLKILAYYIIVDLFELSRSKIFEPINVNMFKKILP